MIYGSRWKYIFVQLLCSLLLSDSNEIVNVGYSRTLAAHSIYAIWLALILDAQRRKPKPKAISNRNGTQSFRKMVSLKKEMAIDLDLRHVDDRWCYHAQSEKSRISILNMLYIETKWNPINMQHTNQLRTFIIRSID